MSFLDRIATALAPVASADDRADARRRLKTLAALRRFAAAAVLLAARAVLAAIIRQVSFLSHGL